MTELNGENMKKLKIPAKHPFYKYTSVSRTIVRNSWLFHFMIRLIELLLADRTTKLSTATKAAYKETLAPHHPTLVRTAASLAMLAVPKREKFVRLLTGAEDGSEEACERLGRLEAGVRKVWEQVVTIISENNYGNLP